MFTNLNKIILKTIFTGQCQLGRKLSEIQCSDCRESWLEKQKIN